MMMGAFVLIDGTELSLFCAIFAILHEFCHIIVLKREGGGIKSLETKTVGISLETGQISYKSEIKIALAGPVFNFACFVIFGLFCYFLSFNKTLVLLCVANFGIFLINILPLYPLDGGRALYCFLCLKFPPHKARFLIKSVCYLFLLPLGILSVIIFIRSGFNLSLLIICMYLLVLQTGDFDI